MKALFLDQITVIPLYWFFVLTLFILRCYDDKYRSVSMFNSCIPAVFLNS